MSSHYRKVQTSIWLDAKFCALSDDAKLLFLMLLTHPGMTSIGAIRASVATLASDLGWTAPRTRRALQASLDAGMAEMDERLILLPNFLRYNRPENPNVVKSWARGFSELPECGLKRVCLSRAKAFAEGLGEAFRKAFREAFAEAIAKGMRNQEQEQKHLYPIQGGTNPEVGVTTDSQDKALGQTLSRGRRAAR